MFLIIFSIHYLIVRDLHLTIHHQYEELQECAEEIEELKCRLRTDKKSSDDLQEEKKKRGGRDSQTYS